MVDGWKIYRLCDVCWGTGTTERTLEGSVEIITCPQCHGDTIIFWGYGYEKSFDELPPEPN